jgi:hypothetical protein
MLSVGVIIDSGEIKGVALWMTGSALLFLVHAFHTAEKLQTTNGVQYGERHQQ